MNDDFFYVLGLIVWNGLALLGILFLILMLWQAVDNS